MTITEQLAAVIRHLEAADKCTPAQYAYAGDAHFYMLQEVRAALALMPGLREGLAVLEGTWRCFRCDFSTTDKQTALAHFGDGDDATEFVPLCKYWQSMSDVDKAEAYQDSLKDLNAERDENMKLRTANEGLEYRVDSVEAEIASRFKGCRTINEAWCQFDSMEGRALAAEERLAAAEATAAAQAGKPQLEWEGPDEDGDLIVTLKNMPNWGIGGHGKTLEIALHCLGQGLDLAGADDCPDCAAKPPRCAKCNGPHPFDTVIPSVVWNEVIRAAELPEYLCTTCIVEAFARAGKGFTATLWGADFNGLSISVAVADQVATDAAQLSEENTELRATAAAQGERIAALESDLRIARIQTRRHSDEAWRSHAAELEAALQEARKEVCNIWSRVDLGQRESALNCVGLALTAIDAALQPRTAEQPLMVGQPHDGNACPACECQFGSSAKKGCHCVCHD